MKKLFRIILLLNILSATSSYLNAKEYREIAPFRSTRADVVRLLGAPPDENEFRAKYETEKERVYVVYARGLDSNYHKCTRRFSPDTVVLINVILKTEMTLADLNLDEKEFDKIDQSYFRSEILTNSEKGIFLTRDYEGEVFRIKYTAAGADRYLCPPFQQNPERSLYSIHLPLEIGKYQDTELQLHLDRFYQEVIDDPSAGGVLINYGTDKEVSARTAKIIKWFKKRKYDLRRIRFVRGSNEPGIRTQFFAGRPQ